jgi:AraC-like DNA-binding protein
MTAKSQPGFQGLLESLDLRILTVQRIAAGRWWHFDRVVSPFSRLWLVLDGRATVTQHDRTFVLRPGSLHLVPAFTPHDCRCSRRFDHYHLHLFTRVPAGIDLFSLIDVDCQVPAPTEALPLFERLEAIYPNRKLPCFDPFREEYRDLPASLERRQDDLRPDHWLEAQGILRLLLAPMLGSARRHEEGVHSQVNRKFQAVQEFIHEHMAEPVRLADLAGVTGLHPTYFSDRFHELVGLRPLEYLMRRRIERAQYLLLTSHAPVKEIAFQVGLRDPAYFTRVFTHMCGTPPSAYRSAHGH